MRTGLFFCSALVVSFVILGSAVYQAFADGCMAGACHQELTKAKYMHGPVAAEAAGANGCKMCHVPSGAKCSAGKGGTYKIKTKGLCVACHAKGTGSQHSAKEIESKCLQCHDPHGSDVSPQMLRAGRK